MWVQAWLLPKFRYLFIVCLFVCNRGDTIQYQGGLQSRELGQAPMLLVFQTPRQALSSHLCQQMVWLYWLQDRDGMPNWYTINHPTTLHANNVSLPIAWITGPKTDPSLVLLFIIIKIPVVEVPLPLLWMQTQQPLQHHHSEPDWWDHRDWKKILWFFQKAKCGEHHSQKCTEQPCEEQCPLDVLEQPFQHTVFLEPQYINIRTVRP